MPGAHPLEPPIHLSSGLPRREGCSPAWVSWVHEGVLGSCPHHHCPQSSISTYQAKHLGTCVWLPRHQPMARGSPWSLLPLSFLWRGWGLQVEVGEGTGMGSWACGRCGVDPDNVTIINALIPLPGTFFSALLCWFLLLIAQHSSTQVTFFPGKLSLGLG